MGHVTFATSDKPHSAKSSVVDINPGPTLLVVVCRPAAGGGRGRGRRRAIKITMLRQERGLRGRADGRAVKAIPRQSGVTACTFNSKQLD